MKKTYSFALMILAMVIILTGCKLPKSKKVKMETLNDSASYVLGADIGKNVRMYYKGKSIEVNWDILSKGLMAQLIDTTDLFTDEQKKVIMERFQADMQTNESKKMKAEAEINIKAGEAFLAENKKKAGVIELPDGLQYKIIKQGNGKSPKDTDVVTVHYLGKLITGEIFDSSKGGQNGEPGQPATFKLGEGMIKGFTEGLQLIKEGGIIELYMPSGLAYGDKPAGEKIKAGSTLIFEVEMIKVGTPPKEAPKGK